MNYNFFLELLPIIILFVAVLIIGWLLLRIKRSGRSMATTVHGAMYETYNQEKRASTEHVIEQKVKKMSEQESDKPIE